MADNLGFATMQVIPSFKGIESRMESELGGAVQKAGAKAGSRFGGGVVKGALVGVAGVGAALAGVGVGLFKIGESFDDAFDTIRIGTGKTGAVLSGLENDFKAVVQAVPTDFDRASAAITTLNERLGITGKPLQQLSEQFLELSRLTKTDVSTNVQEITRLFGAFNVKVADQPKLLDQLFRTTQATGIGIQQLAQSATDAAPIMRSLGFSFSETTALLAQFEKVGIGGDRVIAGLQRGFANIAKAGKDPRKALFDLIAAIQKTGLTAKNQQAVIELFGSRAGVQVGRAIAEGKLSIDSLIKTIAGGHDTILGAAKDTNDFAEKWLMFKNKVLVFLEPLAARVFTGLSKVMDFVGKAVPQIVSSLRAGFDEGVGTDQGGLVGFFATIGNLAFGAVQIIKTDVIPVFRQVANFVTTAVLPAFERIYGVLVRNIVPIFAQVAKTFISQNVLPVLRAVGLFLINTVIPPLVRLVEVAGGAVRRALSTLSQAIEHNRDRFVAIGHAIRAVAGFLIRVLEPILRVGLKVAFFLIGHAIGIVINVIAHLVDVFHFLGKAASFVVGLGRAFLGFAKIVIGALVAPIVLLVKFRTQILHFFAELPGKILSFLAGLPAALLRLGAAIITGLWDGIKFVVPRLFDFILSLPFRIIGALLNLGILLFKVGVDALTGLVNGIVTVVPALFKFFISLPGRILKFLIKSGEWLLSTGVNILKGLLRGIVSFEFMLFRFFVELPGRILGFLVKAGDWLLGVGRSIIEGLWHGLGIALHTVVDFFKELPGRIKTAIGDAAKLLFDVGKHIVEGLWNGIKSLGSWIGEKVKGFIKDFIPGPVRKLLGLDSPSKLFMGYGRNIVQGLAIGIHRESSVLQSAIDRMMKAFALPGELVIPSAAPLRAARTSAHLGSSPRGAQARGNLPPIIINNPVAERSSLTLPRALRRAQVEWSGR